MSHELIAVRDRMRTPRAAAVAGVVFSLLMMAAMSLFWLSLPGDPSQRDAEVVRNAGRIALALDLVPFAGIAFLWFVGVLRDRLGELEDRFFSTVFLGSGLLFLAMFFTGVAMTGGVIRILAEGPPMPAGEYALARLQVQATIHVYALKMAGVFMISTSTILLRTGIVPRWMPFLGYALALFLLLLTIGQRPWVPLVFPLWVLVISTYLLFRDHRAPQAVAGAPEGRA
jgi:hypothetical protein